MTFRLGLTLIFHAVLAQAYQPDIAVLVGRHVEKVEISGIDLLRKNAGEAQPQMYKGRKSFSFNCEPLLKRNNLSKSLLLTEIESNTGLLSVNDSKLRGKVQIVAPANPKGCHVVNILSLETYIGSVLAKEMSSNWPLEALKAQAVAARSYAYKKIQDDEVSKLVGHHAFYDLENSEKHQVNGDFFDVTFETSKAQRLTKGEVLVFDSGKVAPVFFHSKCGGMTRRPDQVWSNEVEGYQNVECPFCHKHGTKDWERIISKKDFYHAVSRALGKQGVGPLSKGEASFKVAPGKNHDALLRVYDDSRLVAVKKSRLRTTLGRKWTMSNTFEATDVKGKIVLKGKGFGHGVGLCQFGAYEMAKRGFDYQAILKHYFPNFKIKKVY